MLLISIAMYNQIQSKKQTSGANKSPETFTNLKNTAEKLFNCQQNYAEELWLKEHLPACKSLPHQHYESCIQQTVDGAKTAGCSISDSGLDELPSALLDHPQLGKALSKSLKNYKRLIKLGDISMFGMIEITKPVVELLPPSSIAPLEEWPLPR